MRSATREAIARETITPQLESSSLTAAREKPVYQPAQKKKKKKKKNWPRKISNYLKPCLISFSPQAQSASFCYQIQAHSVGHMTGQLAERWDVEARNTTLFRKPADWEDDRLMSRNIHLIRVWMPVSFIERERDGMRKSNEKGHESCKSSLGMASIREGMC